MRPACARPRKRKKGDFWQNEAKFIYDFNRPRVRPASATLAHRAAIAADTQRVSNFSLGEPEYPERLRMIDDPPPVLAVRGKIDLLAQPLIAIVARRLPGVQ